MTLRQVNNFKEAEALAQEIDKDLRATDPRFRNAVYLRHEDGSTFIWNNAFLDYTEVHANALFDMEYVIVFTEHHGFHVYNTDDVIDVFYMRDIELQRDS